MAGNNGSSRIRIGIDVGGTFTDLFLLDQAGGRTFRHKLPSTPSDPYLAPIQGLADILRHSGAKPADVRFIGLGTTVATNALLERKGAVTALITTQGFRDLLEIGRQRRPHAYDLFVRKPEPLVPRRLRFEIAERIGPDGAIITPLETSEVLRLLVPLAASGVQSIAICLLNSYANPVHEQRIAELIRSRLPELAVTSSQELIPEFREYERLSSTVVNAYLMPVMKRYLTRFSEEVRRLGVAETPFVMNSGGGIVSPVLAGLRPIDMLLSGPSGGVSGAIYQAALSGYNDIISFDMGGTSTDVCLIQQARAEITHVRTIDALPIRSTAMDIHTVGAGGSSIAWIDAGGLMRVGPHSAGAMPGPACFGNEGAMPTVTDANVTLGLLNQEYLLDGALHIDASSSVRAIDEQLARQKGLTPQEAAAAILALSHTSIAQAIRFVSVERGLDPAEFVLVAFGGAGPLHAAAVARELNMDVLVPPAPGVLCAMGVLTKDIQLDVSQTRLLSLSDTQSGGQIDAIFENLEQRALTMLADSVAQAGEPAALERTVDARYVGQNFELTVPVPAATVDGSVVARIGANFHAAHERLYGYEQGGAPIELVTFRLKATLAAPRPALPKPQPRADRPPTPRTTRQAHFGTSDGFVRCPVFARAELWPGTTLTGPAIIEQMDTTTVVPPDFNCLADEWGNLILRRAERMTR